MSKLYVVMVSLILLSPLAFFLSKYLPYYLHELSEDDHLQATILSTANGTEKTSERLGYLEELTSLPVVGGLFLEEKIAELMKLGRFADVIEKSGAAIQSPFNARSFSIWYHRALSQCLMKQLEDCEASLNQATLYANTYTEGYVQGIYTILEELSKTQKMEGETGEVTEAPLRVEADKRANVGAELEEL